MNIRTFLLLLTLLLGLIPMNGMAERPILHRLDVWSGRISVTIERLICDPNGDWGDGLLPAPDIYYMVSVNEHKAFSKVWGNTYQVSEVWSAHFDITTRDKFVWIQIAVFDDDTNLDDYIIDIDPTDGFALDLMLSLVTGHWCGDTSSNSARGDLSRNWAEIKFNITMNPLPTNSTDLIDTSVLSLNYSGLFILGNTIGNIMARAENFSFELNIKNPTTQTGFAYVHFTNIDPEFIAFGIYENSTERGVYSATVKVFIEAQSELRIRGEPWYVTNDVWFFAISDNQPGSGVSMLGIEDAPYLPTNEYRVFSYYFTEIINPLWGVNAGDVVGGYGGGVIIDETPYGGLPPYDTQFREFYMLTGLKSCFYFVSVGNHDNSRFSWMPRHHAENTRKEYLGNKYYSFSYSHTHVMIIDSYEDDAWSDGSNWWVWDGQPTYGGYVYGRQLEWIRKNLEVNRNYTNKVAVFHIPIVNKPDGDHTINDEFFNKTNAVELMQIFLQNNLSLMIVGHIHNYSYYYTFVHEGTVSSSYEYRNNSVPTLMIGGGGAHNEAEWLFPPIEGSYHFALINARENGLKHYIFKYEEITDRDGNPLTSIRVLGPNDGSSEDLAIKIYNNASVSIPYIRIKLYMKSGNFYAALSTSTNTYEKIYQRDFRDYTVVYVETNVSAKEIKEIRVFSANISGFIENSYSIETTDPFVEFVHNFTYTGNVPARIRFTSISDAGWKVRMYLPNGSTLSEILLKPGDKITFIVNVSVEYGTSDIYVDAYYLNYLIDRKIDRVKSVLAEWKVFFILAFLPLLILISKRF